MFQQDNASIHTSGETLAFFDEMQINVMEWPARSPDLNPIDNLWAILSQNVCRDGRQFSTTAELTEAIISAWSEIRLETLQSLIASMPSRCVEVIEHRGNKTSY